MPRHTTGEWATIFTIYWSRDWTAAHRASNAGSRNDTPTSSPQGLPIWKVYYTDKSLLADIHTTKTYLLFTLAAEEVVNEDVLAAPVPLYFH